MKKFHTVTLVSVVLNIAAIVGYSLNYTIPPLIIALLAFFAATAEVAVLSSWFQFTMVLLSAAILGAMLDLPFDHPPLLTFAVLLAAAGSIIRISLFKLFSYTGYLYTELVLVGVAIALYLGGNLLGYYDWKGYVFPAPVLIFTLAFALNTLKDNFQMLKAGRRGYQVKIGKPAKEFTLLDQDGNPTDLSGYRNKRHLLLIFVRGDWCPGCHMMLRTYEKERERFREKNILVMAIGPDPVGVNHAMVQRLGLDFKVLSDEGQKTARIYGVQLQEYDNAFAPKYAEGIPLPASFLIDWHGIVRYASRPDRIGEFLDPARIFPVLAQLD